MSPPDLEPGLEVEVRSVLSGLEAQQTYRSSSLDELTATAGSPLGDRLGGADTDLEQVDHREALAPLLDELPEGVRASPTGPRPGAVDGSGVEFVPFRSGQEHQRQAPARWSATLLRGGVLRVTTRLPCTHGGKRGPDTYRVPHGSGGPS